MGKVRDIVYAIERYFPEVERPKRHVPLKEKFMWTGIVLLLYFVLAEIRVALVRRYLSVLVAVIRVVVAVGEHIRDGERIHRPAVSVEVPLREPILVAVDHAIIVGVIVGRVGDADQCREERLGDARDFPIPVLL